MQPFYPIYIPVFVFVAGLVGLAVQVVRGYRLRSRLDKVSVRAGLPRSIRSRNRELLITLVVVVASSPLIGVLSNYAADELKSGDRELGVNILVWTTSALVVGGLLGIQFLRARDRFDYSSFAPLRRDLQDAVNDEVIPTSTEIEGFEKALSNLTSTWVPPILSGRGERAVKAIVDKLALDPGEVVALAKKELGRSNGWRELFPVGWPALVPTVLVATGAGGTAILGSEIAAGFTATWAVLAVIVAVMGLLIAWRNEAADVTLRVARTAAHGYSLDKCVSLIQILRLRRSPQAAPAVRPKTISQKLIATVELWIPRAAEQQEG